MYYRSTSTNQPLLNKAAEIINAAFNETNFVPEDLYIVTWFEVGYYGQTGRSKVFGIHW